MCPTLNRHLPRDRKLAWLETGAPDNISRAKDSILQAWRSIGPEAVPSMKRVAAKLSADPKNAARMSYAGMVAEAIEGMKTK